MMRWFRCCFLVLIIFSFSCSFPPKTKNINSHGKNIICFGDSITYGKGAAPNHNYPSLLSKKLNIPVINAGINGDTTKDALKRLKEDVLDNNPLLVIIELGANDYLRGIPTKETISNLEKMIKAIQAKGAMVAITEIHSGFVMRRLAVGVKKLATRYKALYIPNIMEGILGNEQFLSDTFHPNDKGYELIAEKVYKKIEPLLEKNRQYSY